MRETGYRTQRGHADMSARRWEEKIDYERIQELMDNPSTALVKLLMTTWKPIAGIG